MASPCTCVSIKPGHTTSPVASIVSEAFAPASEPTSTMRSAFTAMSARKAGLPVPSTTSPLRIRTSYINEASLWSQQIHAGDLCPHAIHRTPRRDKQCAAIRVAPAAVGRLFRDRENTVTRTRRIEYPNPFRTGTPNAPLPINLHSVGTASLGRLHLGEHPAFAKRSIRQDPKGANVPPRTIIDVQRLLVRRERESVGLFKVCRDYGQFTLWRYPKH